MNRYDCLKIENQLCFPLYACAKEVVRRYTPLLERLDLTYTQYITMMVLWECGEMNVKELGRRRFLDSGTLTPLLKKLEAKGFIARRRSAEDERSLLVSVTEAGNRLREEALSIPAEMGGCMPLTAEEAQTLHGLLHKILENIN